MSLLDFITNKPVLIGLHLGFAIIGIDAFFWVAGEIIAKANHALRMKLASLIGVAAFAASWLFGGYYYVVYYGSQVKPIIKSGLAPWAHLIVMEAKEHIFLFILPLAITVTLAAFLSKEDFIGLRRSVLLVTILILSLGLAIGIMGFIISAAARWG